MFHMGNCGYPAIVGTVSSLLLGSLPLCREVALLMDLVGTELR